MELNGIDIFIARCSLIVQIKELKLNKIQLVADFKYYIKIIKRKQNLFYSLNNSSGLLFGGLQCIYGKQIS